MLNNQEHQAGISIWNSKLQIVEVLNNNGELLVDNMAEVYFNEFIDFVNDKEPKILSTLQSAFDELLLQGKFSSKNVSFTLPSSMFYLLQCPYESSFLPNDLMEEFNWELQLCMPHVNIKDTVLQFIEVNKPKLYRFSSAIIIITLRKYLHTINKFCKTNNLNLLFIDNCHLSAEKTLNNENNNQEIMASIFISHKAASFLISSEDSTIFFNNYFFNHISELPDLINNELEENENLLVTKEMIDVLYISGEDVSVNIVNALGKKLEIEVVRSNPFENIKVSNAVKRSNSYLVKHNSFASAVGIAFRSN